MQNNPNTRRPAPARRSGLPAQYGPQARKVALILPLSDRLAPAGRAVRDGYLASYYAYRETGGAAFDIVVLDQDSFGSAGAAYDAALAQERVWW